MYPGVAPCAACGRAIVASLDALSVDERRCQFCSGGCCGCCGRCGCPLVVVTSVAVSSQSRLTHIRASVLLCSWSCHVSRARSGSRTTARTGHGSSMSLCVAIFPTWHGAAILFGVSRVAS
eukprot:15478093-Alexandrium_andersonii.AAC.1